MSMSEFEKQQNKGKGEDISSLSIQRCEAPDDFTEEELAFAAELNALFSLEGEDLPPYYVQTLLNAEEQRFEPVERGFEHKTSARVFRRLKLRRRLFYTHTSPLGAISAGISDGSMRRSLLALVVTYALIMVLTVAFTGASFASGVAVLLRGANSGAYLVNRYPLGMVQDPDVADPGFKQISLRNAQLQMHFPIYWPQRVLPGYSLSQINLHVGLNQQWADGAMLEFGFRLPPSKVASQGTGEVWVREFKPRDNVLQLVKEGASVPIEMDSHGRALAIYVDGQWSPRGKNAPEWVYGVRSELIYQLNGIVFWIVGDQRDGVGENELMKVAQGLAPYHFDQHYRIAEGTPMVNQISSNVPGPFSNDVIVIFPDEGGGGPYYISVSSYQPPKSNVHIR